MKTVKNDEIDFQEILTYVSGGAFHMVYFPSLDYIDELKGVSEFQVQRTGD